MAIVSCPECGGNVSDRADKCPHCGNPMNVLPPVPPVSVPQAPATIIVQNHTVKGGPRVGYETKDLRCPYCNGPLSSKDVLSSSWAKCPHCKADVALGSDVSEFDDNQIIERLSLVKINKEQYHNAFMCNLMDSAPREVFDDLKVESLKYKYFWVREFGRGEQRAVYPLSKYGKKIFQQFFGASYVKKEDYGKMFAFKELVRFNNDDVQGSEIVPRELSASESKYEFSQTEIGTYASTSAYFCIPVVEEEVSYGGSKYVFYGLPGAESMFCKCDFPKDEFLSSKPKYTDIQPFVTLGVIALCAVVLLFVISKFQLGFWNGVGCIFLMGCALSVGAWIIGAVGGILLAPVFGIDAIIRNSINKKRQKRFRAKWDAVQAYKKESAARNLGLNLSYVVPEFPY